MHFHEKLCFLMDVTKTSNNALARYVSLDASYISRLRNGKRTIPHNQEIIKSMSSYFARNCKEEYQKKAIQDTLNLNYIPSDPVILTDLVFSWLLSIETVSTSVEAFLGNLIAKKESPINPLLKKNNESSDLYNNDLGIFYGVEGKRQAALYFLHDVLSLTNSKTLLLYSDEDTTWMTNDPAFTRQWAELMFKILGKGHSIKIIHTVSRDLDEMLDAISQWMPLYMAGTIEPYFYPKKRDGVFKRTMFITPGVSAVVSSSVGIQSTQSAIMLLHNPAAIASFEDEFLKYLNMCRPLMKIFTLKHRVACLFMITEFEKEQRNSIIRTESLSLLTMPVEIFEKILKRNNSYDTKLIKHHKERINSFKRLLQNHTFSEIIVLPEPKEVSQGSIKVALSDMLNGDTAYYTKEEYLLHLHNIANLLNDFENYHVHFVQGSVGHQYTIYIKEDLGVIVAKSVHPPVVLALSESNIVAAFWDFLKNMIGDKAYENYDRKPIINKLSNYIKIIE